MTQKRFRKLLMANGICRDEADIHVDVAIAWRRGLERFGKSRPLFQEQGYAKSVYEREINDDWE